MVDTMNAGKSRLRPLTEWVPTPGASANRGSSVAPGGKVLLLLPPDLRAAGLVLALAVRVFDARRGVQVLAAVQGTMHPRESDAEVLISLLPEITDDPSSLPDIELVGPAEGEALAPQATFRATGRPAEDAITLLALARHLEDGAS